MGKRAHLSLETIAICLKPCLLDRPKIALVCNSSLERGRLVANASAACASMIGLEHVSLVMGGLKAMKSGPFTLKVMVDSGRLLPEPEMKVVGDLSFLSLMVVACSLRETRFKEVQEIADLVRTSVTVMNPKVLGVILAALEDMENTDNIIGG